MPQFQGKICYEIVYYLKKNHLYSKKFKQLIMKSVTYFVPNIFNYRWIEITHLIFIVLFIIIIEYKYLSMNCYVIVNT